MKLIEFEQVSDAHRTTSIFIDPNKVLYVSWCPYSGPDGASVCYVALGRTDHVVRIVGNIDEVVARLRGE